MLPFTNLSSDPEQGFFSDGITEEITGALAKISDLRVVARTSAFQFKGENKDIRGVGQALGATHLRRFRAKGRNPRPHHGAAHQNRRRDAYLDGDYDRELTDVFAIEEEIATAIAGSLRMPLGLARGERLIANRSIDPESYQQYLRARPLVRARARGVPAGIKILEPLVAPYPDFAPALAPLATAYGLTPNYSRNESVDEMRRVVDLYLPNLPTAQLVQAVETSREKAEPAARKAIQLDPNLADGYIALGTVQARAGKFLLAEELYLKALELDASQPEALNMYSQMFSYLGLVDKSLALRRQSLALEPFDPNSNLDFARLLWLNGEDDAALAILKSINLPAARAVIIRLQAGAGRFDETADTMLSAPSGTYPADALKEAVRLLRVAPPPAAPQNPVSLGGLDFVYLFVGAPDRVLEQYERNVEAGWMTNAQIVFLWHPSHAPARKTERFKDYARKVGFVEYWRAKGWPDVCRPVGADDFVCD